MYFGKEIKQLSLYIYHIMNCTTQMIEDGDNKLQDLLEKDMLQQKSEQWSKLDKTSKIQLLHAFAEKYGHDRDLPIREIRTLKKFFVLSLNQNKLQKNKDVQYAKDCRLVMDVPALYFSHEKQSFSLKNLDTNRISTMKSLTPKKHSLPL